MSDAEPTHKPSRVGQLLGLVRQLIDYGKQLAAALCDRGQRPLSGETARPFGTSDVALILARITRGLLLAEALEARVVRDAASLDAEPAPPRAPSQRKSPGQARGQPAQAATARAVEITDPALAPGLDPGNGLPTPEQIAAEIRRRPIGAVIADICRDLGILPSHPLWPELRALITRYGGNLTRLVKDILDRILPLPDRTLQPAALLPSPVPSGTGPPE